LCECLKELRRRRTAASIELRKANRDDQLLKRRNISVAEPLSPVNDNKLNNEALMDITEIVYRKFFWQLIVDWRKRDIKFETFKLTNISLVFPYRNFLSTTNLFKYVL